MLLTPAEKQMAREVCVAFRQAVCFADVVTAFHTKIPYFLLYVITTEMFV